MNNFHIGKKENGHMNLAAYIDLPKINLHTMVIIKRKEIVKLMLF